MFNNIPTYIYIPSSLIMLKFTEMTAVNLFAFASRLFHEDFSPICGAEMLKISSFSSTMLQFNTDLINSTMIKCSYTKK